MTQLFELLPLGDISIQNRVIMDPLTRMRSLQPGNYYAQRSTAGLIISEATQISQQGQGYLLCA